VFGTDNLSVLLAAEFYMTSGPETDYVNRHGDKLNVVNIL